MSSQCCAAAAPSARLGLEGGNGAERGAATDEREAAAVESHSALSSFARKEANRLGLAWRLVFWGIGNKSGRVGMGHRQQRDACFLGVNLPIESGTAEKGGNPAMPTRQSSFSSPTRRVHYFRACVVAASVGQIPRKAEVRHDLRQSQPTEPCVWPMITTAENKSATKQNK